MQTTREKHFDLAERTKADDSFVRSPIGRDTNLENRKKKMNRLVTHLAKAKAMVKRNEFLSLLFVFLLGFGVVLGRTLNAEWEDNFLKRELFSNLFKLRDLCAMVPSHPLCKG